MDARERLDPSLLERARPTIRAAAAMMLMAVVGLWASSALVARLLPGERAAQEFLFVAAYYLPFVALPVALYARRRPGLSAALRLKPMPGLSTLAVVFAAALCVYLASAANGLWAVLLDALGLREPDVSVDIAGSGGLSLAILYSAAMPAIFEELLCRGVVFSAFESRGTWRALWMSSAMFALMHGNLYGLPAYTLVGAVSAFLVFSLDSLYAGITFHTVYNSLILILIYLTPAAGDAAPAMNARMLTGVAVDVLTFALLLWLTLRLLDRRRRARGIAPVPHVRQPLRKSEWALLAALGVVFAATNALVLAGG